MLATVSSATLVGVDGHPVSVEVHVSNGLPGFRVVGLPDASCRESRDRVRGGDHFERAQVAAAAGNGQLGPLGTAKGRLRDWTWRWRWASWLRTASSRPMALEGLAFVGELGLDGSLRRVPGRPPTRSRRHRADVVVPPACAREAALVRAGDRTSGRQPEDPGGGPASRDGVARATSAGCCVWWEPRSPDLAEVRGQAFGRQALEVAAAGGHHLLMVGPAGAGKTMLARRLPGLLPALSHGRGARGGQGPLGRGHGPVPSGCLSLRPPFRSPHHSASAVSLIGGGGARLRPGEISCAHRGVLFLDELAEFPGSVLDNLRQPLEEGRVVVCRASAAVAFPARFMLVAAMNACRCGADGSPGSCRCPEVARARYAARISGPLLDRFDLRIRVRRPTSRRFSGAARGGRAFVTPPGPRTSLRRSWPPGCEAARPSGRGGARRALQRRGALLAPGQEWHH